MRITIVWSLDEIQSLFRMKNVIDWLPAQTDMVTVVDTLTHNEQPSFNSQDLKNSVTKESIPKKKKGVLSRAYTCRPKFELIDIFEQDKTGRWSLFRSCHSIIEAAMKVWTDNVANISAHVDAGTIYKGKYKFISRIEKVIQMEKSKLSSRYEDIEKPRPVQSSLLVRNEPPIPPTVSQ